MDKHTMDLFIIDNFKDQLEARLKVESRIIKFCEDGDLTGMMEYTKNLNHACGH